MNECGAVGGMKIDGKRKYSEKTHPNTTLSTTNSSWPDPDSNSGLHSGILATAIYL